MNWAKFGVVTFFVLVGVLIIFAIRWDVQDGKELEGFCLKQGFHASLKDRADQKMYCLNMESELEINRKEVVKCSAYMGNIESEYCFLIRGS